MHDLEKQALQDPFLADAIDGYAQVNRSSSQQLSLLQTQLHERIAQQQENKNVFNYSWQRLSVAATAGLLFLTACILLWIKIQQADKHNAAQPKRVEVTLTPKASVNASFAKPAVSWEDYKGYLDKRATASKARVLPGKVIISFKVGADNELSNFKIQKGIDKITNDEAIRIIKEGPKWFSGENQTSTVTFWFK